MKVLAVDDNKQNINMLETILKNAGYEVVSAGNGEEGLAILQQGPVDLIISDILMPKMDGFQLCLKCKDDEKLKNIPFIMTTATYTEKSDENFCLQLGAGKVVVWPIEPDEFIRTINEVLEKTKKEGVAGHRELDQSSVEFLKGYNERVVKQLEHKMVQLEDDIAKREQVEKELKKKLGEAEIFYKAAMDREDKILELKRKLAALEKEGRNA
ncbi:MAG: response regulator [Candidatus Margulisiibacteriota bacterium]